MREVSGSKEARVEKAYKNVCSKSTERTTSTHQLVLWARMEYTTATISCLLTIHYGKVTKQRKDTLVAPTAPPQTSDEKATLGRSADVRLKNLKCLRHLLQEF